jgi:hypothetical protein
MKTTTKATIKRAVKSTVRSIIDDYNREPETDRETLIERINEECDSLFGELVQHGRIDQYESDDLVETAQPCAEIIAYANEVAWVEDDYGLWEGLKYGVLASIAYFSLRNILYQAMKDAGHDSNEDFPFAKRAK